MSTCQTCTEQAEKKGAVLVSVEPQHPTPRYSVGVIQAEASTDRRKLGSPVFAFHIL